MLHGRKIRQVIQVLPNKLENSGCEESSDMGGVEGKVKEGDDVDEDNDDDAEDAESGNESEGTQPEEVSTCHVYLYYKCCSRGSEYIYYVYLYCKLGLRGRKN
jgi:hypothetical protein